MGRKLLIMAVAVICLSGCAGIFRSEAKTLVPEVRTFAIGEHPLGKFKNGDHTPYRIYPKLEGDGCMVGFITTDKSRLFDIVLDNDTVYHVDNDGDMAMLGRINLDKETFYLKFRQDMEMTLLIYRPVTAKAERAK